MLLTATSQVAALQCAYEGDVLEEWADPIVGMARFFEGQQSLGGLFLNEWVAIRPTAAPTSWAEGVGRSSLVNLEFCVRRGGAEGERGG